jgi:diguanylate cyclase (GGDEF)-like protein/PAS domain S-box-containing protein
MHDPASRLGPWSHLPGTSAASGGAGAGRWIPMHRHVGSARHRPAAPGLPDATWERRHRGIQLLLVAHLPGLLLVGLVQGRPPLHVAVDLLAPALLALIGCCGSLPRRGKAIAAALGLMSAAAVLVHLTEGQTTSHFLYFVLLGVLSLYDDWVPYAVAVGFVLVEHGVLGAVAPAAVYEGDQQLRPWQGALVHGGFVLAASVVALVARRWAEADRAMRDEQLRASEQRFRLTFEAAPIGVALVAVDGRFLAVNPALCALLGYGTDELLALDFQTITHPDDLAEDLALLQRCIDGTLDGYTLEKRYVRRDGRFLWAQLNVALARDSDEVPRHFVSQILDISERRAATAEAGRFAALVEHSTDVITITDRVGCLRYASPAFGSVLGYAPEERIGRSLFEDIHPDDRAAVVRTRSDLQPGASRTLRYRHAHADGGWRWVEATMTDHTTDPSVGGIVTNTRDVTEQVEALDRLAHEATHDSLTGLANRTLLEERLNQALGAAQRHGEIIAAVFVDLDHFKDVNDTLGHHGGDLLLVQVAERLLRTARRDDTVARLGGDEFVVIGSVGSDEAACELARRVHAAFHEDFDLVGTPLRATASVGVATTASAGDHALLDAADAALYAAKAAGRDRWAVHGAPVGSAPSDLPSS